MHIYFTLISQYLHFTRQDQWKRTNTLEYGLVLSQMYKLVSQLLQSQVWLINMAPFSHRWPTAQRAAIFIRVLKGISK